MDPLRINPLTWTVYIYIYIYIYLYISIYISIYIYIYLYIYIYIYLYISNKCLDVSSIRQGNLWLIYLKKKEEVNLHDR